MGPVSPGGRGSPPIVGADLDGDVLDDVGELARQGGGLIAPATLKACE
jgi:hypothetical protein